MSKVKLCDRNCNQCPVILHPSSRMLTSVLNELANRFGDDAYAIVQGKCPNFTVCYDCGIDDFTHMEGCQLAGEIDDKE